MYRKEKVRTETQSINQYVRPESEECFCLSNVTDSNVHCWSWYQKSWSSRMLPILFNCFSGLGHPCVWNCFHTATAVCQPWALLSTAQSLEQLSVSHISEAWKDADWLSEGSLLPVVAFPTVTYFPACPLSFICVCVRQTVLRKLILCSSGCSWPVRQSETSLS